MQRSVVNRLILLLLLVHMLGIFLLRDENHQGGAGGFLFVKAHSVNQLRALPNIGAQLSQQINKMERRCFINMRGLECSSSSNQRSLHNNNMTRSSRSTTSENLIVAGVGYSREDFSIKPQILKSGVAVPAFGNQYFTKVMTTANEYFQMINPSDGQSVFNGMYSHSNMGIDLIFNKFFAGELYIVDSQKQYFSHSVQVNQIQVTDEFQQIIDILPEQMDWDLYNMVISAFGDSIATNIKYGGVVDMTVSIRSCFNDPQMMIYLSQELQFTIDGNTDTSKLPNGYIRYHKVSQLDIVGGNPEISNIRSRVDSFSANPIPVKLETIPIWRAFPDGPKQANMKRVYESYLQTRSNTVQNLINTFNAKKEAEANLPQLFTAYQVDRYNNLVKFGSPISLEKGQSGTITDDMILAFIFIQNPYYPTQNIAMKPVIHRNLDGTFYFNFITGQCSGDDKSSCKFQPGVSPGPATVVSVTSTSGKSQCIQLFFRQYAIRTVYSSPVLYVCSGCMPVINGKDISCNCPYIQ